MFTGDPRTVGLALRAHAIASDLRTANRTIERIESRDRSEVEQARRLNALLKAELRASQASVAEWKAAYDRKSKDLDRIVSDTSRMDLDGSLAKRELPRFKAHAERKTSEANALAREVGRLAALVGEWRDYAKRSIAALKAGEADAMAKAVAAASACEALAAALREALPGHPLVSGGGPGSYDAHYQEVYAEEIAAAEEAEGGGSDEP